MARLLGWSPEAIEDLEAEIGSYAIRERFVHSYRVIYSIEDDRIPVAASIHGSRLLQPFLLRDQKPG